MDHFSAARVFVRAAELRSFSKAAHELEVEASTVSRQVAELERDLGIALFNRSTRGLALTEGGKTYLTHVGRALAALEEARTVTMGLNLTPKGVLRVTMPPAFGRRHVLPSLPEFLERYPQIDVEAVLVEEHVNLIEAGIDLALRIGAPSDSGLTGRRLATHRTVACAHRDYLARAGVPAHPRELAGHACLGRSGKEHRSWTFQRGERTFTVEPTTRFRTNDLLGLLELALGGAGIAIVPDWLADDTAKASGLERVLPGWTASDGGADLALWALYPPKKTVSSKVRAFLDFFAARLGT